MVFSCKHLLLILVLAALALPTWAQQTGTTQGNPPNSAQTVDPDADSVLRKMSNYLTSLKAFKCTTDNVVEAVLHNGEKLQFLSSSTVYFQRPNKLRSDRIGDIVDARFYYNGKNFALYGKKINKYTVLPAPPNIDKALDDIRSKYGIDPPAADLLYQNPYAVLMEDVVSGTNMGPSYIHGVRCHHLAYRGREVDWQIWVEDSKTPLPRRYVITSKNVVGSPEYIVTIYDWNTSPKLSSAMFNFVPPKSAQRIDAQEFEKLANSVR